MIETVIASTTNSGGLAPVTPSLLPSYGPSWRRWIGPAISLAVLIVSLCQLRQMHLRGVLAMVPASPRFWLLFAATYLAQPTSEWLIFRRLWQVPASALLALIRKRVSNEVLLGYSGEIYFYAWARRNAAITTAPFGAIKDVAILSAAVGNAFTLILLVAAWPLLSGLHLGVAGHTLALSVGTMALSSLSALCFRRALFSSPDTHLQIIAGIHGVRVIATTLLTALLWATVLPSASLGWWLGLATLRMLVSRLPFIPNKDLVFAGLVSFLVGPNAATADLFAMLAGLTLVTHLLLGAALGLSELLHSGERRCR
jgi:hypothetical protein